MSRSAERPPRASTRGGAWVLAALTLPLAALGAGWLLLDSDPTPTPTPAPTSAAPPAAAPRAERAPRAPLATEGQPRALLRAPAASAAALRVRVVDAAGAPLSGARVALRAQAGAVRGLSADAAGRACFSAPSLPAELIALAPGHLVPAATRLSALPSEELVLQLEAGASLRLQVEGPRGPLAGASAELYDPPVRYLAPDAPARSDAAGSLSLSGLPPAPAGLELSVRAPGHAAQRLTLPALPLGGDAPLPVRLEPFSLALTLDASGLAPGADLALELRGEAVGARRRLPMAQAELELSLAGAGAGWARLVQGGPREGASPWRRFEVSDEAPRAELGLRLAGQAPLAGLIVDPAGEPLSGVRVEARDPCGALLCARSGPDGRFRFAARAGERYRVEARRLGCTPFATESPAPEENLVLILTPASRVVARPFRGPDGRALASARLAFDPGAPDPHSDVAPHEAFEVALDAEGRLDLSELPAGRWTISLREPAQRELRAWVLEAELEPGQPLELGLSAPVRHPLRGRVEGAPRAGRVQVDLRPVEPPREGFGFVAAAPVDEEGSFGFGEVPPGRYRVVARWEGGRSEVREVEVPEVSYVGLAAE